MHPVVFLIHGLGPAWATGISLVPLKMYLQYHGFTAHIVHYDPNQCADVDDAVAQVDAEMRKVQDGGEVILVGQSMGGVVANEMHKHGWDVKKAVYIGSPLNGAGILNTLESMLPRALVDRLNKPAYDYLKTKAPAVAPPHAYRTISMGWAWSSFDGCVYRNEATIDETNHDHLAWADHRTVFANPRLWYHVQTLIVA